MRHHIRAVLFDLDGVVVFTDKYHYLAWKKLADERGWKFDEEINHKLRGIPRLASLEIILKYNNISLPEDEKISLANLKNKYYVDFLQKINESDLYPGVVPFLKKLRAEGVKLGLCSSSKNATIVLEKLGLVELFDVIITGADIEKAKPDPEIFLKAAERLHVPPFHCLVFEDAESGIEAAHAAKMKCIGVGHPENLPNAVECIQDYDSIEIDALKESGRAKVIPSEEWNISENNINRGRAGYWGTIFALSNGYLGVRGSYEEDLPDSPSHPATFVNGVVGYEKYNHIWAFPGFAERLHAVLNICDWTGVDLWADGEKFGTSSELLSHHRTLDLKRGVLRRCFVWKTRSGKKITVQSVRFVSMVRRHCAAMRYEISSDSDVDIRVVSYLRMDMPSKALPGKQVQMEGLYRKEDIECFELVAKTGYDSVAVATATDFYQQAQKLETFTKLSDSIQEAYVAVKLTKETPLKLEKFVSFYSTIESKKENIIANAFSDVKECRKAGFERILEEQTSFWGKYWDMADIKIDGCIKDLQALRFSLFHLRQSHPEDPLRSISANGSTGDKYCGHVFWDTEMYMLPHFLYTEPEIVKPLLMYRYNILDKARERAKQLDGIGACYSWNSITGEECCVVFEAATAEYHLNSAIAWAIFRYVDATGDLEFLYNYGAEILFETARFMFDLGGFVPLKGGKFCINAVCGPDEYGCGINNNCYLNSMAQWHFRYAAKVYEEMQKKAPEKLKELQAKTSVTEADVKLWLEAADKMFIPYNEELGIHEENDTFLGLEPVDMSLIPKNTDIREMMHPLNLWRLQVVKQADVVLLMFVLGHQYSLEDKKRNYEFYEPITNHGSSLSASIHSIIASEIGKKDDAYYYFRQSVMMDLNDFKNNTQGGIHSACLGGTWMAVINGFAGMRDYPDGLHFDPQIPEAWNSYSFKIIWHGRKIKVDVDRTKAIFTLISGEACEIKVKDKNYTLQEGKSATVLI